MNEIKLKVNFGKRTCVKSGISLTTGDYNSTKIIFEFDREDGTKIFEMKNPNDEVIFVDEIINNEVVLVGQADVTTKHNDVTYIKYTDENDTVYWYDSELEKLYNTSFVEVQNVSIDNLTKVTENASLFTMAGRYVFEISLYDGDSKLTSKSDYLNIKEEQVVINDNMVSLYLPVFDRLIGELDNLDIDVSKSGTTTTVELTKKDGTSKTVQVLDGIDGVDGTNGQDATINGVNTLTIEAGDNITLEQTGSTLTINSTGGSGGTSNYQYLTNKPSINEVILTGNKSLSDLGIQPAGNYLTEETDPTVPSHVKNITQANITSWNNKSNFSGNYNDLTNKPTIPDVSNFITKDVNDLTYYELKTNTGSIIELSINSSTYVVTLNLKNSAGTVISTGNIDLPLESVVVNGSYNNTTKKVILTLQSGSTIEFSVADLVAGLQSEITSTNKLNSDLVDDENSTNKFVSSQEKTTWNNKSDFSGSYNDLTNKPTIPSALSDLSDDSTHRVVSDTEKTTWNNKGTYSKPTNGIPKSDLANDVQTSLGKADTALQSYTEQYTGTITGITMNGVSKGTSGVVDLGTVITSHQDITGKEDTSNKVTSLSSNSTDTQYPSAKCVYDLVGNISTVLSSLVTVGGGN